MENKKINWSDVEVHLLGQKIEVSPIEYSDTKFESKFEGEIVIHQNEFEALLKNMPKAKKVSNYQKKKLWKKYFKMINKEL